MTGKPKKRRRIGLTVKQRALLNLLRQRSGDVVSQTEILAATKWKRASWRVYVNNGLYAPYLWSIDDQRYHVALDASVSDDDFFAQIPQRARKKTPGGQLSNPRARALLERSRENMMLAIESYNRPSLANRLDVFALLFCTAWEQLLKAEIIETDGDSSIFKATKPGRRRETIGLAECVKRRVLDKPTRTNIKRIADLRNAAAHFLVPELQAPLSYLFQAGALNFAQRFREMANAPFLPRSNIGLLALAEQGRKLDAVNLSATYGPDMAKEIADYARTLEKEIRSTEDQRFAVTLEIKMRFATSKEAADVTLTRAAEAPSSAIVLEKPVDPEKTYPLRTAELQEGVAKRLGEPFNNRDLQSVLSKTGWKRSKNQFHRLQRNPDTHKYSLDAVDETVRLMSEDPEYLTKARRHYARALAKSRRK